jgi:hypothetical protein
MKMKEWREVLVEVFKKKTDSVINIIALALAVSFIPYLWLKIILCLFILYSAYRIVEDIRSLKREKHVPLAVIVYGDESTRNAFIDDSLRQMDKWHFDEVTFSGLGVNRDDWCISHSGDLPADTEQWQRVVQEFQQKLDLIKAKLKGPEIFHILLKCRIALAFGLGATVGTWSGIILHQEISAGDFKPVIYLDNKAALPYHHNIHTIKNKPELPYKFIQPTIPEELTTPTLVALHLASHDPGPYVKKEAKNQNLSCVIIDNTYNNTLTEEDWFQPAQEVASVLRQLREQTDELRIYASCPIALAFAIGMALGNQFPASIFHWFAEDNTYHFVLKLNKLK